MLFLEILQDVSSGRQKHWNYCMYVRLILCLFALFLHQLVHLMKLYVSLGVNTTHCICATFLNIFVAEYCYLLFELPQKIAMFYQYSIPWMPVCEYQCLHI
jgi:hypothetical protein